MACNNGSAHDEKHEEKATHAEHREDLGALTGNGTEDNTALETPHSYLRSLHIYQQPHLESLHPPLHHILLPSRPLQLPPLRHNPNLDRRVLSRKRRPLHRPSLQFHRRPSRPNLTKSLRPLHHRRSNIRPSQRLDLLETSRPKQRNLRARVPLGSHGLRGPARSCWLLRFRRYRALPDSLVWTGTYLWSSKHVSRVRKHVRVRVRARQLSPAGRRGLRSDQHAEFAHFWLGKLCTHTFASLTDTH
jgi:hypothetical protein